MKDIVVTKKDIKPLDKGLTYDICSESNCGASVVVELDFKNSGRKVRCSDCIVRMKFRYIPPLSE